MRYNENGLEIIDFHFTGTQVNYYFVCQRKLWFFSKHMPMESNSDTVLIGKVLHEDSYKRKVKEFMIDETIVIDFVEHGGIINEIKKSNKMEKAHIFQMLYYLYYLKQKGMAGLKGTINYPLLREKVTVELTEEKQKEIENVLCNIKKIIEKESPPELKKLSHCRACSYYELCWI
jgi:CRISPR-associated exonuclease Cas4